MPIKMVKMITKTPHTYGTRALVAGNEFEARGESEARLLAALGRAERAQTPAFTPVPAPAPEPAPKRWSRRTEQKPPDTGTPNPTGPTTEPVDHGLVGAVRRYGRRDLTSTED